MEPLKPMARLLLTLMKKLQVLRHRWVICRAQAKNMYERITQYLCLILKCVENHLNAKSPQNVYVPPDCSKIKVNLHLGDFYKLRPHAGINFSTAQRLWFLSWFLFLFIQDLKQVSKSIFSHSWLNFCLYTKYTDMIFFLLSLLAIFNKHQLIYVFWTESDLLPLKDMGSFPLGFSWFRTPIILCSVLMLLW